MRGTDKNRLQVLRRVRDYLKPMATDPAIGGAYAELEAIIERMTAQGVRQDAHARQAQNGTSQVTALARSLRDDLLAPVAQLVKTVAPDAASAGLPGGASLRLPRSRDLEGLATAAHGLYQLAMPFEDRLVAAGLPKDHLAALMAAGEALRAAIDARAQDYLQRAAAGSSAIAEGKRAVQLLRLINSLVRPRLRGDAGKVRAWQQARRLGRGNGTVGEVVIVDAPATEPVANVPVANVPVANVPVANVPVANVPVANVSVSTGEGAPLPESPNRVEVARAA